VSPPITLLHARTRRRPAITLAETLVSVVLVGGVLVLTLDATGASLASRHQTARLAQARALANDLAAEVFAQAYSEPVDPPAFGPESGEGPANRTAFDDLDDYHNWTASPPQAKDGTVRTELPGWGRTVVVEYVGSADPMQTLGSDAGLKRVTVTVTFNGSVLAKLTFVRAS